jgi:nucleoside-diphosphate-sugar epimerase
VRRLGAAPVLGDLGSVKAEMLAGAEAVIHCAAFVEEWGTRAQFWEANVTGTEVMLAAARAAGVRRFVHVGTEAAVFAGRDLIGIDETAPYPVRHRYLYSETKAEAEKRVLAANGGSFETISIRPRLVWGPRDTTVLPAVLQAAKDGIFAWVDGGRALTSTTHVANLVHALELSLVKGTPGRAYFVADEGERTLREFLTGLAATRGVDLPSRSVPGFVLRPLARAIEGAYRLARARRRPPMTRLAIDMMSSTITVRTDRARAELGYAPVIGVADGLAELRAGAPAPRSARIAPHGELSLS